MPRILLADDNSRVRHGLREMLETEPDFEVCAEASNGIEAVALTASELPEFVILDLSMPHLNGLEAAQKIHERFPDVVILLLTMHDPIELMDEVAAFGVRTCILKTDLSGLMATLRTCWPEVPKEIHISADADEVEHQTSVLTEFELQIVQMLAQAKSSKDIAATLLTTEKTIELHRAAIMHKLQITSTFELVKYATRNKLVATLKWPNAS